MNRNIFHILMGVCLLKYSVAFFSGDVRALHRHTQYQSGSYSPTKKITLNQSFLEDIIKDTNRREFLFHFAAWDFSEPFF